MRRVNKVFMVLLPVFIISALAVLAVSLKNYRRNEVAGGCGCDFQSSSGDFDPSETAAIFMNTTIAAPLAVLPEPSGGQVLGDVSPEEKWIEVDLSEQKIIAWQGGEKFLESPVSSGKTGKTPTGEFNIWAKYKYTKMSGGSKENGTYYYLPNVPYTMYFYNSYGLHGTYWHNNFGHPMSHGCVNLPTVVAEKLFYWTTPILPSGKNTILADKDNKGTRVVIHD